MHVYQAFSEMIDTKYENEILLRNVTLELDVQNKKEGI